MSEITKNGERSLRAFFKTFPSLAKKFGVKDGAQFKNDVDHLLDVDRGELNHDIASKADKSVIQAQSRKLKNANKKFDSIDVSKLYYDTDRSSVEDDSEKPSPVTFDGLLTRNFDTKHPDKLITDFTRDGKTLSEVKKEYQHARAVQKFRNKINSVSVPDQQKELKQFVSAYPGKARGAGLTSGAHIIQESKDNIKDNREELNKNQKSLQETKDDIKNIQNKIDKNPKLKSVYSLDKDNIAICNQNISKSQQKIKRSKSMISKTNPKYIYYDIKSGEYPEKSATLANSFEDMGPYKPKRVNRINIMDLQPNSQYYHPEPIIQAFSKSGMKGVHKEQYYLDHKTEIDNKRIDKAKAQDQKVTNNDYGTFFDKNVHPDRYKEYGIVSGTDVKNIVNNKINGVKASYFDAIMNMKNKNKSHIDKMTKFYGQEVRPYKHIERRVLPNKAYDEGSINWAHDSEYLKGTNKTPQPISRKDLIEYQKNRLHDYKVSGMTPSRTIEDTGALIKSGYPGVNKLHKQRDRDDDEKHEIMSTSELNKDARQELKTDHNPQQRQILKELIQETNNTPAFKISLYDVHSKDFHKRLLDRSNLKQYVKTHPVAKEAMEHKADFDKYDQAEKDEDFDAQADSEILSPHEAGSFSEIDAENNYEFYQSNIKPHEKAYKLYEKNIKTHKYNDIVKQDKINKVNKTVKHGVNVAPKGNEVTKTASSQLNRRSKFNKNKKPQKTQSKSNKRARLIAKKRKQGWHR